jgi:hypothetical protein
VGTNLQIYDGLPTINVEQVSQGDRSIKAKVDLKHTNQISILKVEQVEQKEKGRFAKSNLKDDVKIRFIDRLYNQRFKKFLYYCWFQKHAYIGYETIRPKQGRSQIIHMNHTLQLI